MRVTGATGLIGIACTVWAALPLTGANGWQVLALITAVTCVAAGTLRLSYARSPLEGPGTLPGPWAVRAYRAKVLLLKTDWEIGAIVAIVAIAGLYATNPWHTGLLGIGLTCYLLMVHQAESSVRARLSPSYVRALLAGLALLAATTGVAMAPSARPSTLSGWLEALAALAAITAAALALPL